MDLWGLPERVKFYRNKKGLSQSELADAVGYYDRSSISKLESGLLDLPLSRAAKIAKALDVDVSVLLGLQIDTESDLSIFSKRLIELRKREGLSQADLAKALNCGASTIGMYESGKREPSLERLVEISSYFKISLDYLLQEPRDIDYTMLEE